MWSILVDKKTVKRITHITLGILSVVVILSGLGIAYYQTVTYLTLGFLDKTLAFKLHTYLFPLFLIILILHSFMPSILRAWSDK
jgi:cytochrome b subunit of formate dehydrogenase